MLSTAGDDALYAEKYKGFAGPIGRHLVSNLVKIGGAVAEMLHVVFVHEEIE